MGLRMVHPKGMDQADRLRRLSAVAPSRGLHVAIVSGKGGVGKTNIAVNLAAVLAVSGQRVTLVDLDAGLANADVLLNVHPRYTLADVLSGERSIEEVAVSTACGIRFIGGGSGEVALADMDRGERSRLARDVWALGKTGDTVIYDCGAGISQNVLAFAGQADVVTVVSTPEPTSLTDAYAMTKTLVRSGFHGSIQLLLNMVESRTEAREIYQRVAAVVERFLHFSLADGGYVLQDRHVELAVRERTPMVLRYPRCPSSLCLTAYAARFLRAPVVPKGPLLARFVELFV